MLHSRNVRACFDKIDSVLCEPMEDLDERQKHELRKENGGEVLSEYRHGQQRFDDGLADFFVDPFYFEIS